MRTIYLVTTGCYSDYSVVVSFETEALANAYVEAHNATKGGYQDEYGVEELSLLDEVPGPDQIVWAASQEFENGALSGPPHVWSFTRYPWTDNSYQIDRRLEAGPRHPWISSTGPNREEVLRRLREEVASYLATAA